MIIVFSNPIAILQYTYWILLLFFNVLIIQHQYVQAIPKIKYL